MSRQSSACNIPAANCPASSLLLKFSPHTCRASRHWWKLGVAWLYFSPRTKGQLMTTYKEETTQMTLASLWEEPLAARSMPDGVQLPPIECSPP